MTLKCAFAVRSQCLSLMSIAIFHVLIELHHIPSSYHHKVTCPELHTHIHRHSSILPQPTYKPHKPQLPNAQTSPNTAYLELQANTPHPTAMKKVNSLKSLSKLNTRAWSPIHSPQRDTFAQSPRQDPFARSKSTTSMPEAARHTEMDVIRTESRTIGMYFRILSAGFMLMKG